MTLLCQQVAPHGVNRGHPRDSTVISILCVFYVRLAPIFGWLGTIIFTAMRMRVGWESFAFLPQLERMRSRPNGDITSSLGF